MHKLSESGSDRENLNFERNKEMKMIIGLMFGVMLSLNVMAELKTIKSHKKELLLQ